MTGNMDRLAERLRLAFQLEGLAVGTIEIQPHHCGYLEVTIAGKGPFMLPPALLEASNPEGSYVSEDLRAWIDQAYLERYGPHRR